MVYSTHAVRRIERYIHERADWPDFRWDVAAIQSVLVPLSRRRDRILGRMDGLGLALREEAALRTLTLDVVASSEIEGETLNPAQVRSSIVRRLGLDPHLADPSAHRKPHVDGVVAMMVDATHGADVPLTAERLFGWHRDLFPELSGRSRMILGAWRVDPIQVGANRLDRTIVYFEGPEPTRVPGEMAAFLGWIEADETDGILQSAIAHLWFVTIHPFEDGNGRIGRAIADRALARSEGTPQRYYSMSAQLLKEQKAYYAILERTQKGNLDITEWLLWFIGSLGRALDHMDTVLGVVLGKARFWGLHAGNALHKRQVKMLNAVLDGQVDILTSSKWAKMTQCSHDTALRDIGALVALGILVPGEEGGRSTCYHLASTR